MTDNTTPATTYAVIYAAKSTEDKNASIPEQLDDCQEMCDENGWIVIGKYVDENFTAYTGNRGPGLASAIKTAKDAAVEKGATNEHPMMLVAQHTSRFARGDGAKPDAPKALMELYHEWARCNVRGRLVENDLAMTTSSAAAAQGRPTTTSPSASRGRSARECAAWRSADNSTVDPDPSAISERRTSRTTSRSCVWSRTSQRQ
jgi:hypothetical protein